MEYDWRPDCGSCGKKHTKNIRTSRDGVFYCSGCWKWIGKGYSVEEITECRKKTSCDILGIAGKVSKTGLVIDHCHETGKIRGVISHNVNKAEGFLRAAAKESGMTIREVSEKLLKYLGE